MAPCAGQPAATPAFPKRPAMHSRQGARGFICAQTCSGCGKTVATVAIVGDRDILRGNVSKVREELREEQKVIREVLKEEQKDTTKEGLTEKVKVKQGVEGGLG